MCRRAPITTLAVLAAGLLVVISAPPALAASPSVAPTSPTAPSSSSPHPTVAVPPAAPTPTSNAKSPGAPDPHPPAGGIGPIGEAVGGAGLQTRGLAVPAGAPALPTGLTATAWVLVDLDSGNVIAAQDPHGRYQPASILKILTVDTLLPKLPGDRTVTVSAAAASTEGSGAGLIAGGTYTIDQLFSGLLLVSGNDTAMALAEAAGGVPQTVAAMNAEALSLGAYDTFVETPSGLDGWNQLTSAYDMALFLQTAIHNPRFVAYDQQPTATLPVQHVNGNGFDPVKLVNQSQQYFADVPGGFVAKTGFTDAAQHTYLAAADRGGRRLGVVFMRAQRWPLDQYQQAAKLFDWGYALPATTTPVGHLDAAYIAPKTTTKTNEHGPASATHAGGAGGGAHSASAPFTSRRLAIAALVTLGVLVVVIGLATVLADLRHRRGRAGRAADAGREG